MKNKLWFNAIVDRISSNLSRAPRAPNSTSLLLPNPVKPKFAARSQFPRSNRAEHGHCRTNACRMPLVGAPPYATDKNVTQVGDNIVDSGNAESGFAAFSRSDEHTVPTIGLLNETGGDSSQCNIKSAESVVEDTIAAMERAICYAMAELANEQIDAVPIGTVLAPKMLGAAPAKSRSGTRDPRSTGYLPHPSTSIRCSMLVMSMTGENG